MLKHITAVVVGSTGTTPCTRMLHIHGYREGRGWGRGITSKDMNVCNLIISNLIVCSKNGCLAFKKVMRTDIFFG